MGTVNGYIKKNREAFLDKWFEALRIPSVSALPEHKGDVRRMAEWWTSSLAGIPGMKARLIETKTTPLVFAESPKVPGAPTVLVYGHYDVQPVDPVDLWRTPPFEPTVRDGKVFCRGADDDKGQSLTHFFAVQSILGAKGSLPLQVKFILEGEEEVGSSALSAFLTDPKNRKLLATNAILVSDTDKPGPGQPGITYGLRGVVGFELELTGPNRDLHSGLYGGSVMNPAFALCGLLNSLMDSNGKIQIPGFYDAVLPLDDQERKTLAERPFDEKESLQAVGLDTSFGEPEFTVMERRGARPSFDINGLTSGYQGKGGKTIIPAKASSKFTFRLVPNQDPKTLHSSLRKFLKKQLPAGIKMKLTLQHGAGGMVIPLDSPYMKAAAKGLKKVFGKKPFFLRDGGSIAVVTELRDQLKADLILAGFGLEEDGIHSPNEFFRLEDFYQGIEASAAMIDEIAKI